MHRETFRAGDVVHHIKSGEEWLVAAVEGEGSRAHIHIAGYPHSIVHPADIRMIQPASDEQHFAFLHELAASNDTDPRFVLARRKLEAYRTLLAAGGVAGKA